MDDDRQILCVVKKVGTARAFGIECNDFYTWAELDNQQALNIVALKCCTMSVNWPRSGIWLIKIPVAFDETVERYRWEEEKT